MKVAKFLQCSKDAQRSVKPMPNIWQRYKNSKWHAGLDRITTDLSVAQIIKQTAWPSQKPGWDLPVLFYHFRMKRHHEQHRQAKTKTVLNWSRKIVLSFQIDTNLLMYSMCFARHNGLSRCFRSLVRYSPSHHSQTYSISAVPFSWFKKA